MGFSGVGLGGVFCVRGFFVVFIGVFVFVFFFVGLVLLVLFGCAFFVGVVIVSFLDLVVLGGGFSFVWWLGFWVLVVFFVWFALCLLELMCGIFWVGFCCGFFYCVWVVFVLLFFDLLFGVF